LNEDLKIITKDLGSIFLVVGIMTFFVIIVPLFFGEYEALGPILLTAGIFFLLGGSLYKLGKNAEETDFKCAMIAAALAWLFVSLISSIPFLFMSEYGINEGMEPVDAVFESFSGWSGTGLSMIINVEGISHTLQFWRSIIQWIGGVGVIILTLAILARPGTGSFTLYKAEGREERTHPSVISTVRSIWWIFLIYTFFGIILLCITGMPLWEAINHCMTSLSTGGFSVINDSMTSYGVWTQLVLILLMIFGAIAFVTHHDLLKGKLKKFISDPQVKALFLLLFVGTVLLSLINYFTLNYPDFFQALQESIFQFVSAITCTGAYSTNVSSWSNSAKLILSTAMVVGGAAGSTAGGIKLFRAILLSKGVLWRTKQAIYTKRIFSHKLGGRFLSSEEYKDEVNEAAVISFLWLVFLFFGVISLSVLMPHAETMDIVFDVCSAQGNVGLSTGVTGPTMPFAAKIVLIFNMWIGRLEIIPIIVLLRSLIGKD